VGQFANAIGIDRPRAASAVASSSIRAASQRSVGLAPAVLSKYFP
jgi:hypothetical protein